MTESTSAGFGACANCGLRCSTSCHSRNDLVGVFCSEACLVAFAIDKSPRATTRIPGVPADLKSKSYKEMLHVFETFAKEKPGATSDEHIALGLMFLCVLRDGDDARRRKFEADVLARLEKLERPPLLVTKDAPCVDGRLVHDMQGQAVCPRCGYTPALLAPDPAKPLYVGDDAPRVFEQARQRIVAVTTPEGVAAYEPEPEGSEEL